MRQGQLLILESTTYPGTTEEILLPMLHAVGLDPGVDVEVAFSPERTDPGNKAFGTRTIPKVVGGLTPRANEAACALYARCIDTVVSVSSPKVAEMVKLLENTFRSVNIALGQRDGDDLRSFRHRRLGGHRSRRHEAVRVHAVLSGSGAGRALHSGRSALFDLEGQGGRVRAALHRARRARSTRRSPASS